LNENPQIVPTIDGLCAVFIVMGEEVSEARKFVQQEVGGGWHSGHAAFGRQDVIEIVEEF
jgi:hypothetical protein